MLLDKSGLLAALLRSRLLGYHGLQYRFVLVLKVIKRDFYRSVFVEYECTQLGDTFFPAMLQFSSFTFNKQKLPYSPVKHTDSDHPVKLLKHIRYVFRDETVKHIRYVFSHVKP